MKIQIDVDIPEGYEATGEYRVPNQGEWVLNQSDNNAVRWCSDCRVKRIILRKKFVWPSWLKGRAIFKNYTGNWFCSELVPTLKEPYWLDTGNLCVIHPEFMDIQLPDVHYTESLIINPKV